MSGDYISLYNNSMFAENDLVPLLSLMFLFFGRMLPIIALVPFFGGKVLPRPAKMAFAISLFVIFLPQLFAETTTHLAFNFVLVSLLIKEILIGIVLGFFLSIPFMIVQSTGILTDHQRGASSLMINDPTMQGQSSPLGTMYNYVMIYLFFVIDGPFIVLDILSQSFTALPVDKFFNPVIFSNSSEIFIHAEKIVGNVMILSTQLAAPALIMILMTDFFLGIANRLAPQVQITFLGMPLKSLLALVVIFFGWTLFLEEIVSQAYKALSYMALLVKAFSPL